MIAPLVKGKRGKIGGRKVVSLQLCPLCRDEREEEESTSATPRLVVSFFVTIRQRVLAGRNHAHYSASPSRMLRFSLKVTCMLFGSRGRQVK